MWHVVEWQNIIAEESWCFFRHVTSVEKDKTYGTALQLLSDGLPSGHWGLYMTRVPHTLEPVLKFLSRGREIALDTGCKTFLLFSFVGHQVSHEHYRCFCTFFHLINTVDCVWDTKKRERAWQGPEVPRICLGGMEGEIKTGWDGLLTLQSVLWTWRN